MGQWLSLMDYSNKYNVSISTLRRRIKSEEITYSLDNGKYFVPDTDIKEALKTERNKKVVARRQNNSPKNQQKKESLAVNEKIANKKIESNEAVFSTANQLLDELKKSYMYILQEKESQIIQLRSEVSDLKTLVRVLEDEVRKQKNEHSR